MVVGSVGVKERKVQRRWHVNFEFEHHQHVSLKFGEGLDIECSSILRSIWRNLISHRELAQNVDTFVKL